MLSKSLIQFFGWSVGLCSLPFIYLGPNHWLKNPNIFLPSSGRLQEKNTNRWLGQYLPHGFRDSPHLFGQVLNWDLLDLDLGSNGKILQYVDDLLIFSPDEKNTQQLAIQVLNFLAENGYKVSCAKAQGEGNGTPLYYPCLENPMDGRAW